MTTYRFIPSPALQPYIDSYAYTEPNNNALHFTMDLLPIGKSFLCIALAERSFISAKQINTTPCNLAGLTTRYHQVMVHPAPTLHVVFKPYGLHYFLKGMDQTEFTNWAVNINDVVPAFANLHDQLLGGKRTPQEYIFILEKWLLGQLSKSLPVSEDIVAICKMIEARKGGIEMPELYDLANTSKRSFNRRFKERTGVTAKQYSRIVRFNQVCRFMKNKADTDISDLVGNYNFFDQSHFIHDFKDFSGYTPTEFHQNIRSLSEHLAA
jgi:AraC-like DNA-binding protein